MKNGFMLDEIVSQTMGKTEGFINIARKPDGSNVKIPVVVIEGKESGQVLLVDAGTHGDEYEGTQAVINISKKINPDELKGTLVLIPTLNVDAFSVNSRVSPLDHANLNRIFPGTEDKYITQRIARIYLDRVVKYADCMISFHGGGTALHLEPIIGYLPPSDEMGMKTMKLAKAFGVSVLWRMQNLPFDGVSVMEAIKLGIPAILPEIGSHCSRFDHWDKHVDLCYNGIINVMKELGMLKGEAKMLDKYCDVELNYIHTSIGGIHTPMYKKNDFVKGGEVLANISDLFGHTIHQIIAPYDGVVVGYYSIPVINPGDWSYLFGKPVA